MGSKPPAHTLSKILEWYMHQMDRVLNVKMLRYAWGVCDITGVSVSQKGQRDIDPPPQY